MSVELLYRIVKLSQIGNSVGMILEEARTAPPTESTEAKPETDIDDAGEQLQKVEFVPKPKTQMEEVFSAMRTQFPEFAEAFKGMSSFGSSRGGTILRPYLSPSR